VWPGDVYFGRRGTYPRARAEAQHVRRRLSTVGLAIVALPGVSVLSIAPASEIHDAARGGDVKALKRFLAEDPSLVHATTEVGNTPLHVAVICGEAGAARLLLERGAALDATNNVGWTPLHSAVAMPFPETCRALLGAGADVNARDDAGMTPLHIVFTMGTASADAWVPAFGRDAYRPVLECLLEAGADVNARDDAGMTPLHHAVESPWRTEIEFLVVRGADPRIPDSQGTTALDIARESSWFWEGPRRERTMAVLERAAACHKLARAESQFRDAATCALVCAGLLGLGFAVIAVKMVGRKRERTAEK
jgi:hypothetical protein